MPHSGPFARGIHVTVQASLKRSITTAQALEALKAYYQDCPFVQVGDAAPRVKDVATSNYAQLGAVTNGNSIAVMCVADNLNKGAAGGAIQWMNRLLGLAETTGLTAPPPADLNLGRQLMATPLTNVTQALTGHLAQVFAQYPIEVAHGDGVWLHARDGRKIRFLRRHAVAGLGYGHPRWLARSNGRLGK